jgi:glutamate dehydrogenase/leucine dehydrogenase
MSIKCAVAGLPYGGGKGGIIFDPKELSKTELERLSRAYAAKIAPFIGEDKDVPAPDVNTNPNIMKWMLDEYEKILGHRSPATFTGKPVENGGSLGRTEATGRGGVIVLKALISKLVSTNSLTSELVSRLKSGPVASRSSSETEGSRRRSLTQTSTRLENSSPSAIEQYKKLTVAIQGFGNVGFYFAKLAEEAGFKVVAVSDSKGGIRIKDEPARIATQSVAHGELRIKNNGQEGINIEDLMKHKRTTGHLSGYKNTEIITNEELLELPVDILVPAALENVINVKNMSRIKANIIVEMANGPVTEEAYEYLKKKGVILVPDVLANGGGVTVSYLEWVQGKQGYWWAEKEVNQRLEEMMERAFEVIWNKARSSKSENRSSKIDLKKAAFEVAVERIAKAK